ncbi:hypothetical protein AB6A40_004234 [Gnathostoma spinigerum]|uniref:Costars domain-containing protein n=1 Tax=Gnathostoma spinigerum TaxID=75299 RepID=A0ABD6EBW5_9BILA
MISARQRGTTRDGIAKFSSDGSSKDASIPTMSKSFELSSVRRRSNAKNTIALFNKVAEMNSESLKKNPFSESYSIQHFDKSADDYGRPKKGSKTEARGIKAGNHVQQEVLFLMETINEYARGEPPNRIITFGEIFTIYSNYSNKLVGMLLRARKYHLVDFEGEMLYQRQDESKEIRMLLPITEIRQRMAPSGDPVNCISINDDGKTQKFS